MADISKLISTIRKVLDVMGDVGGIAGGALGIERVFGGKKVPVDTPQETTANIGGIGLEDEYTVLMSLFGGVPDREITPEDIQTLDQIFECPALTVHQKGKLCRLIGFKEIQEIVEKPAAATPAQPAAQATRKRGATAQQPAAPVTVLEKVNAKTFPGRKMIIGFANLGVADSIRLLTALPILHNPLDSLADMYKKVQAWLIAEKIPQYVRKELKSAALKFIGAKKKAEAERLVTARERKFQRRQALGYRKRNPLISKGALIAVAVSSLVLTLIFTFA